MTQVFTITLTCSVNDPQALWMKARDYMVAADLTSHVELIGTERDPDVGACLAMLLDRSEHLDGAEVEQHEIEEIL